MPCRSCVARVAWLNVVQCSHGPCAQSMEFELDDADFLAAAALVAAPAADEEAAEAAEQLGDDFDNAVALLHGGRRRPLGFNRRSAACAKHARACKAQSVLVLQKAQVERRLAAVTDRFAGGGGANKNPP